MGKKSSASVANAHGVWWHEAVVHRLVAIDTFDGQIMEALGIKCDVQQVLLDTVKKGVRMTKKRELFVARHQTTWEKRSKVTSQSGLR